MRQQHVPGHRAADVRDEVSGQNELAAEQQAGEIITHPVTQLRCNGRLNDSVDGGIGSPVERNSMTAWTWNRRTLLKGQVNDTLLCCRVKMYLGKWSLCRFHEEDLKVPGAYDTSEMIYKHVYAMSSRNSSHGGDLTPDTLGPAQLAPREKMMHIRSAEFHSV
ncbi:hypothetical protein B0H17DRAFT_1173492 [Mycena rosella]|uniref:Uncharacterized protein n=1 Tax=Mycena rosella TaxID=1033263 RepID=A0AAD7GFS1_MYCRO|nr:hypothetical protein B0H17DRAFT_1179281 [Mycena rosella]KAJ7710380.1 hypothetical protein B0H17DRAFT_1173492 [Mycena rosella]